jgi:hypothetical protein
VQNYEQFKNLFSKSSSSDPSESSLDDNNPFADQPVEEKDSGTNPFNEPEDNPANNPFNEEMGNDDYDKSGKNPFA